MRKIPCIMVLLIGSSILVTNVAAAHSLPLLVGGGGMAPEEISGRRISTSAHATPPSPASTGRWRGPCQGWRLGENLTPEAWAANPERGALMMARLIACVFAMWAPGQSGVALYVAQRESGMYPWAQNPSSGCSGLFQHMLSLWRDRVLRDLRASPPDRVWVPRSWYAPWVEFPNADDATRLVFDPRANAIAAAKMVGPSGNWGPWSV